MSDLEQNWRKAATSTFTAELIMEGSWGARELGTHESTMDLWISRKEPRGFIEWDIPAIEGYEEIGLWFDMEKNLVDYDGISGYLPKEAVSLLESQGYKVSKEFTGENDDDTDTDTEDGAPSAPAQAGPAVGTAP